MVCRVKKNLIIVVACHFGPFSIRVPRELLQIPWAETVSMTMKQ